MSSEKIDTRTRILESAWKLLESGTASGVRMSDIAKAAGISRQALYLHFPKRSDLLIATTRHIDAVNDIEARLAPSRSAETGIARLEAYIAAWAGYVPLIHGVAKALLSMQDGDEDARIAWTDRMKAVYEGFEAAAADLQRDGVLSPDFTPHRAADLLSALVTVDTWERLVLDCGWPQDAYVETMTRIARDTLVS